MNYTKMIKTGLNARDCCILEKLKQSDQSPGELADELISSVSMTQIADKLLDKGFITRKPAENDRRKYILAITPAGREAIA